MHILKILQLADLFSGAFRALAKILGSLVVVHGNLEKVTEVPSAPCKVLEQLYGKQMKDLCSHN